MSEFINTLSVTKVKEAPSGGRATWRLNFALMYISDIRGGIVVPEGFETDFASVPRLPFMYLLTGGTAEASATIHDWLCCGAYARGEITWQEAALVFHEAMKAEGVPAWRRWAMYWAVRLFGEQNGCI